MSICYLFDLVWYNEGMRKIFVGFAVIMTLLFGVAVYGATPVMAKTCDEKGTMFFALKPWYAGLIDSGTCEIKTPAKSSSGDETAKFVWTIVLNILYDLSVLVGYITIIMIAWGGYLYMFSQGRPERVEKGKKTLIMAVIGLLIAMLSSVIMNTIATILTTKS